MKRAWLKPTEDLYVIMVDPDLGIDIAAEVKTPGGERVIFLVLVKASIRNVRVEGANNRMDPRPRPAGAPGNAGAKACRGGMESRCFAA